MNAPDSAQAGFPHAPIDEPPWGMDIGDWATALHEPLASIELGAYDERILTWIAGWDTPTVVTVVSLLHRARAAQPLQPTDTDTVAISRTELDRLTGDSAFLETLFAHGLDNWEGYADAHDDHESGGQS